MCEFVLARGRTGEKGRKGGKRRGGGEEGGGTVLSVMVKMIIMVAQ